MRRTVCAIIAAAMILCLCSCGGGSSGKSISYAISANPSTLDPQYANESGAKTIINNAFEGLIRLDKDGNVLPGIAKTWETNEDETEYTFHLRDDTEWYCPSILKREYGDEFYEKFSTAKVTANDFVYACRRAADPATASPSAHRLGPILHADEIMRGELPPENLGVFAEDDFTLIITLAEKCPDILVRLTESEFMPCNEEFFSQMGGRYGLSMKHILCNGPYYISYWDPESQLTLKSNKYYQGSVQVSLSSVSVKFESNPDAIPDLLSNGSLSCAFLSPDTPIPDNTKTVKELRNTVFGFMFNCSDAALKSENIRKAFCSSIYRDIFSVPPQGTYIQTGIIPESCFVGSSPYRVRIAGQSPEIEYNLKKAAEYWKKGLTKLDTDAVTVTVLCPAEVDEQVRTQLQLWERTMGISLRITVENAENSEISKRIASGDYQIAFGSIESANENAVNFLVSLRENDPFRLTSKKLDVLTDNLKTVSADGDLMGACYAAEEYYITKGVCFPLYGKSAKFVTSDDASGVYMPLSESTITFTG